jgi:hypothetical protein
LGSGTDAIFRRQRHHRFSVSAKAALDGIDA